MAIRAPCFLFSALAPVSTLSVGARVWEVATLYQLERRYSEGGSQSISGQWTLTTPAPRLPTAGHQRWTCLASPPCPPWPGQSSLSVSTVSTPVSRHSAGHRSEVLLSSRINNTIVSIIFKENLLCISNTIESLKKLWLLHKIVIIPSSNGMNLLLVIAYYCHM